MKKIILNQAFNKMPDTSADLFLFALYRPANPQGGVGMDEMMRVAPIIEKIEEAQKVVQAYILLENSEFDILLAKLKAPIWPSINLELKNWLVELGQTPDVAVQEKPKLAAKK